MNWIESVMARFARASWPVVGAGLVALCLILYLPGFMTLPPVDRDEASFAQASRQMYQSGDPIDIRLQDVPRYKKPVGIYWLQSAAVALTGGRGAADIATYRAVSLVAATLSVLLTWRIGRVLAGPEAGVVAAILLASSFLLGAEARLAKTDATLLATVLVAMLPLARLWMGQGIGRGAAWSFWAALGLTMLVKGPIGLMVVVLAIVVLCLVRRSGRWLGALDPWPVGLAIFVVIVLPWYLAITLRTGGAFWAAALGHDLIGKVASAQESHGAPPGSYLAALWLTFWPGALALALGLPALWAARRQAGTVFLLAWLAPTWIVFEAVATKLVHYVLPVYPALAILTAVGLLATPDLLGRLWRKVAGGVLLALPVVMLGALTLAARAYGAGWLLPAIPAALLAALAGWAVWRALTAGQTHAAVVGLAAMALALSAGFYPTLVRVPSIWPSVAVGAARAAFDGCPDPLLVSAGYREPSVIFALGREVRLVNGAEAADLVAGARCALAFVAAPERAAFDAGIAARGVTLHDLGQVAGTNLGSGAQVRLEILARTD